MVHVAAWQITDTTGNHYKYYRAYVAGSTVVLQYGRIGSVQSTQPLTCPHPAAAIKTATRKFDAKLRDAGKGYVPDGDTWLLDVAVDVWSDPRGNAHTLASCYEKAEAQRRTLAGSLSDGRPHVVASVGTGRRVASTSPVAGAQVYSPHPSLDVGLAVLDAAAAALADRDAEPRIALLGLGHAEDTDTADVLAAALRMWTPGSSEPQGHLQVCLTNARMIFASAAD